MKTLKYQHIKYIEVYVYDGTHDSAKAIIEKIKEFSLPAFNKIVYQKNLIDDTIKFTYYGQEIEKGYMIETSPQLGGGDIGIWSPNDLKRFGFTIRKK